MIKDFEIKEKIAGIRLLKVAKGVNTDYISMMRSERESSKPRKETQTEEWNRILYRAHLAQIKIKHYTFISHLANQGDIKDETKKDV